MRENASVGSQWRATWVIWRIGRGFSFLSLYSEGVAPESEAGRPIKTVLWAVWEGNKCLGNCSSKAWVFNRWANHLALIGLLAFAPASDFVSCFYPRFPQCPPAKGPGSGEPGGNCWSDMHGGSQPHYIRHVYVDLSGEQCEVHKGCSLTASLGWCPLPLFITGLSGCTGAPYFTH